MRQEFGAAERHAYGRPLELDDDLHQVRRMEWAGFAFDDRAEARGVRLAYAKACSASSNSIEAETTCGRGPSSGPGFFAAAPAGMEGVEGNRGSREPGIAPLPGKDERCIGEDGATPGVAA